MRVRPIIDPSLDGRGCTFMEKTLADANIASLRANVAKYREIAERRQTLGHVMVAKQLMEFVVDLEARVAALEILAKSKT
jgi:hypothetical protein